MEKEYRKIFIPKANGYIYIEEYDKGEEQGRAKIYDSNWQYLDYIDTEHITEKEYKKIILQLQDSQTNVEFLEKLGWDSFDCGNNLLSIAEDTFENEMVGYEDYEYCEGVINRVHVNYDTMSEKDFCREYEINKIGDWFAYNYD